MSSENSRLSRTGENSRRYGLEPLSVAEAARILGIEKGAFWIWLNGRILPSEQQSTMWRSWDEGERDEKKARPLPEIVIRLYLTDQHGHGTMLEPGPPRASRPPRPPRGAKVAG